MKKTFTLLAALITASAACAEDINWTLSMAGADPYTGTVVNTGVENLTASLTDLTLGNDASFANSYDCIASGTLATHSTFTPNVRLDQNTEMSWTMTVTLTNNTGRDYTLSGFSVTGFACNSSGAAQSNNRTFSLDASVNGAAFDTHSYTGKAAVADSYSFTEGFSLLDGETLTLTYSVSRPSGNGEEHKNSFYGIQSISFSGTTATTGDAIPEPATATLSLLALAGLAARRRRK